MTSNVAEDRKRLKAGTRIQFSGGYLRSTGQFYGGEGTTIFTVVDCDCSLCKTGRFIAVDQRSASDPSQQRHIAEANTVQFGKPSSRNDP